MVAELSFYVYVLINGKGMRYTGQTGDLDSRLKAHIEGLSRYTARHRPWQVVYTESFDTRSEAMARERYLKTGAGREWLDMKLKEISQEEDA